MQCRIPRTALAWGNRSVVAVCGTDGGVGRCVNLRCGDSERGRADVGGGGRQHRREHLGGGSRRCSASCLRPSARSRKCPACRWTRWPCAPSWSVCTGCRGRRRRVPLAHPHAHTGSPERLRRGGVVWREQERFRLDRGPAASRQSQGEPEGTVRTAPWDRRTDWRC